MFGFYVRFPLLENLNNMIITVGRSFKWASPSVISEMFVDAEDWDGIEFWYNDVQNQHIELERQNPKKK